jgi:hypothetical protein
VAVLVRIVIVVVELILPPSLLLVLLLDPGLSDEREGLTLGLAVGAAWDQSREERAGLLDGGGGGRVSRTKAGGFGGYPC